MTALAIWIMWAIGSLFFLSGCGAIANAIKDNTKQLQILNDDTDVQDIINKAGRKLSN